MAPSQQQGEALERLQLSLVDGRADNVRHRQSQLRHLHEALRDAAGAVCGALGRDSGGSGAEVEAEFCLAMDAIAHAYDSLDFDKALRDEYAVARGRSCATRRVGVGLVAIRPTSHTRLYSVVAPLSAAICAGNCVVLELPESLLEVDAKLREMLPLVLDVNTFMISKTAATTDAAVLENNAVLVDQTGSPGPAGDARKSLTTELLSSQEARVVAIVDRTADVQAAARAVAGARFGFGGRSPYAPDLVLVNEYVKDEFFEACSRHAALAFARDGSSAASFSSHLKKKVDDNRSEATRRAVEEAEQRRQVTSFGSSDFKLVDVHDDDTPLLKSKISGRYLVVATCLGLVDAIFDHQFETPLVAGYFFADPGAAKYMAQHLPCHQSFANHIPPQLLLGPAAPTAHDPPRDRPPHHRYGPNMFSAARPQLVEPAPASLGPLAAAVGELLSPSSSPSSSSGGRASQSQSRARALATRPLRPTRQPDNRQVGFFEQGVLIGAGILLGIVLPAVWYTAYRGIQMALRLRR